MFASFLAGYWIVAAVALPAKTDAGVDSTSREARERILALLRSTEAHADGLLTEWSAAVQWAQPPNRTPKESTFAYRWGSFGPVLVVQVTDSRGNQTASAWSNGFVSFNRTSRDQGVTIGFPGSLPVFADDLPILNGAVGAGIVGSSGRLSTRVAHAQVTSIRHDQGRVLVTYIPRGVERNRYEETLTIALEPAPHVVGFLCRWPGAGEPVDGPVHLSAEIRMSDFRQVGSRLIPSRAEKTITARYPGVSEPRHQVHHYTLETAQALEDPSSLEGLDEATVREGTWIVDARIGGNYTVGEASMTIAGMPFERTLPIGAADVQDLGDLLRHVPATESAEVPAGSALSSKNGREGRGWARLAPSAVGLLLVAGGTALLLRRRRAIMRSRRRPALPFLALLALLCGIGVLSITLPRLMRGSQSAHPLVDLGVGITDGISPVVLTGRTEWRNEGPVTVHVASTIAECACLHVSADPAIVEPGGTTDVSFSLHLTRAEERLVNAALAFEDGTIARWTVRGVTRSGRRGICWPRSAALDDKEEAAVRILLVRPDDRVPTLSVSADPSIACEVSTLKRLEPSEPQANSVWLADIRVTRRAHSAEDAMAIVRMDGEAIAEFAVVRSAARGGDAAE